MRLADALDKFLVQLEADGRSSHTVNQYRRHVRLLCRCAEQGGIADDVSAISHEDIARFLTSAAAGLRADGRRKAPTSVNALRTTLRVFFEYLHEVGLVATSPARRLRRAHCSSPPPRAMPEEDLQRLLATLVAARGFEARRDLALFRLLAESGMRLGSAVTLDVADLDLERREAHLRMAKGDCRQTVVLPEDLCSHLRDYLGGRSTGPLLSGCGGRRISARQVQRRFAQWLERAGISRRTTVHSLRHRFAIRLYRKTSDLFLVQQALGHRSIASTTVYAHVDRSRLMAAVS